jgi:cytochrome P450
LRLTGAVHIGAEQLSGPDAHVAIATLRGRNPVSWVPDVGGWLVTGYRLADEVMRDHATFTVDDPRFSTAQVVGPSMLSLDGADHRRHRAPFLAPFRPSRVEHTFAAPVQSLADDLVARVRRDGAAELRTRLAGPLSVAVMAEVLGLRGVDASTVLDWYAAIVAAVSSLSTGSGNDAAASLEPAARAMAALAEHISTGLSGTSILASARDRLTATEVIANAAVMMFGGIETTEGMIANAVLHLLDNPDAWAEVRSDPALVPSAVEESLRLEPAAAAVDRYATRDAALGGVSIRRGDLVRVSIAGANRDPDVFARPDRFDLHRPDVRAQLAFARGPHACIAMDLARLEARAAIGAVLELPRLHLATPVVPTGLIFRKPRTLHVRWDVP